MGDQSQSVKALRVYPNPVTSVLNVELKGYDGQKFAYRIIDMTGKQVLLGSLSNGRIDLSAVPAGSYTLELLSDEGSSHISFIKE